MDNRLHNSLSINSITFTAIHAGIFNIHLLIQVNPGWVVYNDLPRVINSKFMMQSVLQAYGLNGEVKIEKFGSGLINSTWKVITADKMYILQRINDAVFTNPSSVAQNIRLISDYLQQHYPEYTFAAPLTNNAGEDMVFVEQEGFFRMFPFIAGSHSKEVLETSEQAYEAARQFGRFTKLLSGFDARRLEQTIPHFHDLGLRYRQFLHAIATGNEQRIKDSEELIMILKQHQDIVFEYESIKNDPSFKIRVTHHDTKISNVLFDASGKGLCVIDLDTVMPGYFISDAGDMMRTYLSPVNEEEKDLSKITVRKAFYKAIIQGYYSEMKEQLSEKEAHSFFYAGKFMIYMQALRFLADHLLNDVYYGARYEGHNFNRAHNQIVLLQKLIEKEEELKDYIVLERI
ncbi:MAG TPA: aminoglycoside phosphotransferase family protein [Flavisolibacter sp.]|nr:aminoglycoside phosphotransferase family protein [Flavisolibacter sp.]